ncbi:MAG: hypothetical protein ACOH1V_07885 [Stenotrophomonas sp.]
MKTRTIIKIVACTSFTLAVGAMAFFGAIDIDLRQLDLVGAGILAVAVSAAMALACRFIDQNYTEDGQPKPRRGA